MKITSLLTGAGLGAAGMYLLDPQGGRSRRALVRDKAVHSQHVAAGGLDRQVRDAGHRIHGLWAETKSRLRPTATEADHVIEERVRALMGHVLRHPGSVVVEARDGQVTLRGPILAEEEKRLLSTVAMAKGVHDVVSELEVHKAPGRVPGLQGAGKTGKRGTKLSWAYWSLGGLLIAGLAGSAFIWQRTAR